VGGSIFGVGPTRRTRVRKVKPQDRWDLGVRHPPEATLKLLTIAHRHPEILVAGVRASCIGL
jgi:hypothetical protein